MGTRPSKALRRWYESHEESSRERAALRAHYELLGVLSQGGRAEVRLARHRATGTKVAVKAVRRAGSWSQRFISTEVDILKSLDHPNVIKLYEVVQTRACVYLVMELAGGGELLKHLEKAGRLGEREACALFVQIARGLRHCHASGVVHGDLKPGNILLDARGNVKLSDFGVGSRFAAGQKVAAGWCTADYRAPELFLRRRYDGPKADIWSLGVILFLMVTGSQPFEAHSLQSLQKKIVAGRYTLPPHLPVDLENILRQLLRVDPAERPALDDILQHPWISRCSGAQAPRLSAPGDKKLNFRILQRMSKMGYNPLHTHRSLIKNAFNSAMATYLILQCQAQEQEVHKRFEPADAKTLPQSAPCATFPLPRKLRVGDPGVSPLLLPHSDQQAEPKNTRRATLPAIPVYSQEQTHSLKAARFSIPFFSLKMRTASVAPQRGASRATRLKAKPREDSLGSSEAEQPRHREQGVLESFRRWRRAPRRCVNFFWGLGCFQPNTTAPLAPSPVAPRRRSK
uniref:sperm motility kinase 4A-like n=1 Tax=Jaculus jaculus TaxID=51337 RepID=UPI001E1B38D1|nr:sperm motility kinase 4A-like [Jaculus jaculus]